MLKTRKNSSSRISSDSVTNIENPLKETFKSESYSLIISLRVTSYLLNQALLIILEILNTKIKHFYRSRLLIHLK